MTDLDRAREVIEAELCARPARFYPTCTTHKAFWDLANLRCSKWVQAADVAAELLEEVEQLRAQVERVRELHAPMEWASSDGTIEGADCAACLPMVAYPCETIRVLDGGDDAER